jgi:hypothetical protein
MDHVIESIPKQRRCGQWYHDTSWTVSSWTVNSWTVTSWTKNFIYICSGITTLPGLSAVPDIHYLSASLNLDNEIDKKLHRFEKLIATAYNNVTHVASKRLRLQG